VHVRLCVCERETARSRLRLRETEQEGACTRDGTRESERNEEREVWGEREKRSMIVRSFV